MKTISSTNNLFSITIQGDYKALTDAYVYGLSRTMLRIKRTSPAMSTAYVMLDDGIVTDTKTYYTDPDGAVEIPLRNYVNASMERGASYFLLYVSMADLDGTDVDGAVTQYLYTLPGVSYYDRLAPARTPWAVSEPGMEVLPPTVMCICNGLAVGLSDYPFAGIMAESNAHEYQHNATWKWIVSGTPTAITSNFGKRNNRVTVNKRAEFLSFESDEFSYKWKLENLSPFNCVAAVCLRWTSLTGATRQHWFPVVGYINDTDKALSILSAGDGYRVRKNPVEGLKCRLTGLTAYDVWYYQDMMQASDVHAVSVTRWDENNWPPFNTVIGSTLTAATVEGGMPTTPDGNGFYSFEFTIKMKHYDAI